MSNLIERRLAWIIAQRNMALAGRLVLIAMLMGADDKLQFMETPAVIGKIVGVSPAYIEFVLDNLRDSGWIEWTGGMSAEGAKQFWLIGLSVDRLPAVEA